jgi:hypothetical protein
MAYTASLAAISPLSTENPRFDRSSEILAPGLVNCAQGSPLRHPPKHPHRLLQFPANIRRFLRKNLSTSLPQLLLQVPQIPLYIPEQPKNLRQPFHRALPSRVAFALSQRSGLSAGPRKLNNSIPRLAEFPQGCRSLPNLISPYRRSIPPTLIRTTEIIPQRFSPWCPDHPQFSESRFPDFPEVVKQAVPVGAGEHDHARTRLGVQTTRTLVAGQASKGPSLI